MLITIIYISLLVLSVGLLGLLADTNGHRTSHILVNTAGGLFLLTAIYLLIKNGSFIKSREYRISRMSISIIIVGVLLKIMHWPFASQLIGIGCLSILIIYGTYMIRRSTLLKWMDWVKLLFLIVFVSGWYFRWMHWPYSQLLSIGTVAILIIIIFDFILASGTHKERIVK